MSARKPIRTLIVDDEPHARATLRLLLAKDADIEITAEAADGDEAIDAVRKLRPDLLFLDVQMPEKNGFEVLASLYPEYAPQVVFVTAYDSYALQAFDVNAVDYLLKPFDDDRFQTALDRAKTALSRGTESGNNNVDALLDHYSKSNPLRRISVKARGRISFVQVSDIDWIGAADQYVEIHVKDRTHLVRESMNALERRLPSDAFCRIHRSAIVNVERIKELHPQPSGDSTVILRNGAQLKLARNRKALLDRTMGL